MRTLQEEVKEHVGKKISKLKNENELMKSALIDSYKAKSKKEMVAHIGAALTKLQIIDKSGVLL